MAGCQKGAFMEIFRAAEFSGDPRRNMSEIFVDGFYQWLRFFSKDKARLISTFAHMFNPEVFYIAVESDRIAGLAACAGGTVPSVRLDKKELRKHLGFFKGTVTYLILKKEFEEKKYPFAIRKDMGMVEFVAVAEQSRGRGVAGAIIRHIFESTPYKEYVLEVADTNTPAVSLYEKLGFREFKRVKMKHSKRSGVNALIYMRYEKETH
jgi:ribosomal protein S18 acetylase RimI-like enzyme